MRHFSFVYQIIGTNLEYVSLSKYQQGIQLYLENVKSNDNSFIFTRSKHWYAILWMNCKDRLSDSPYLATLKKKSNDGALCYFRKLYD